MFNELKKSNMFPVVVTAIILLITLLLLMTIGVIKKHGEVSIRAAVNLIEPNEPEDVNLGDVTYSTDIDPNLWVTGTSYADSVMFYLDNKEWATFKIKHDGVVGCNISQAEFLEGMPRCLYSCMGKLDPNETIAIEWTEPNEPDDEIGEIVFEITDIPVPEALMTFTEGTHNICLGEGAGLDLTDESYQFIINVGGDMLQTTMTPEEYQMIYDVVNRAANEAKESTDVISNEKIQSVE